jgi:ligand-binding sensor domain-containing protein/two-component sensor histidine kinase
VVFLSSLLSVLVVQAQEIGFQFKQLDTEDGLPSSEVYEVYQDVEGYIWVSSDAGVSRYNGYEFQNFSTQDGLTESTVFHIYEDFKGRIWFLPYNSQLCYFENDSIYQYRHNDKLKAIVPAEFIRAISIDKNETITFSGRRFGGGSIDSAGTLKYDVKTEGETGELHTFQYGKDLLVYGLEPEQQFLEDSFFVNGVGTSILYEESSKAHISICVLRISATERVVGVGGSLLHLSAGVVRSRFMSQYYSSGVNALFLDKAGRIWIAATHRGVQIFNTVDDFFNGMEPARTLLLDKNVSSILEDQTGGVWLAVQNSGVYYAANPNIEVHRLSNDDLSNRVSALTIGPDKKLYAGTIDSKVFEMNSNSSPVLRIPDAHEGIAIHDMEVFTSEHGIYKAVLGEALHARSGITWTCSNRQLYATDSEGNIIFRSGPGEQKSRYNAVLEDVQGQIWAGSNNGLYQVSLSGMTSLKDVHEVFGNRVEDIDQLADGTLVIGTKSHGVAFLNGGAVRIVDTQSGLLSGIIRDVHVDDDQDVWLATPLGLSRITMGTGGEFSVQNITVVHGLPTGEVNRVISIGDSIWAATNKGMAVFSKHKVMPNETAPETFISMVLVNENAVNLQSSYALTHRQNNLQVDFTSLSYRNAGNQQYRYKMGGMDEEWVVTQARSVRFPSLDNGTYSFQFQAANEDGFWSESKSVEFIIAAPFWEAWWFITLLVLLIALGIILYFRSREIKRSKLAAQEQLLEREKLVAIQSELKALRAQMNPHFMFNTLSAIQTAVNQADTRSASKYIGNFASLIRKVLENSKHARVTLQEELEILKLYIELEQLRFSNRFSYSIDLDSAVDADFIKIPSMILQPFVENAIIHGLAPKKDGEGKLNLHLSLSEEAMHCVLVDNGIGREKALEIKKRKGLFHNSMGMDITEERMELYGKQNGEGFSVEITDLKDQADNPLGTEVELIFPAEQLVGYD